MLNVGQHGEEDHFVLLNLYTWQLPEIGIRMHKLLVTNPMLTRFNKFKFS